MTCLTFPFGEASWQPVVAADDAALGPILSAADPFAATPAAYGHGPFGPARGYVSSVSSIEPNVLGLQASIAGDRPVVQNWSNKTVTILGPDGRPSLRFGRQAVFANQG